LHDAFYIASALSLVAALAAWLGMGKRKLVQPVAATPLRELQPQVIPVIKSTGDQVPRRRAGEKVS
jgi:hypothetical protein